MEKKRIGLSSYALKVIAVVLMTIDHIGVFIPNTPFFLRMIGRVAAPLFFFTLAYSFQHTSSRKKFLFRLYVSSVVMELIKIGVSLFDKSSAGIVENNVFSTMFLAVLLAIGLEGIGISYQSLNYSAMFGYVALVAVPVIWSIANLNLPGIPGWLVKAVAPTLQQAEGGTSWVMLGVGMCVFAKKKIHLIYFYIFYCALELVGTIVFGGLNTLFYNIQWMMIFALPLFFLYNGERGKSNKYFFYIYYPAHIWLLYLIRRLLG